MLFRSRFLEGVEHVSDRECFSLRVVELARLIEGDRDEGEILREKVHDLKQLVRAYQLGWIKETRCDDSVW